MKYFTVTLRKLLLIICVVAVILSITKFSYVCYQRKKVAEEWMVLHEFQVKNFLSSKDDIIKYKVDVDGMTMENAITSFESDLKENIQRAKAYRKAATQPWIPFPPDLDTNPPILPF